MLIEIGQLHIYTVSVYFAFSTWILHGKIVIQYNTL